MEWPWPAWLLWTCGEHGHQAAHLPGLGDPDGSPVGPSPDPRSSSSSNARYGLEPPRLSLTCISSALPPTGVLGKPANRTRFSPESCENEWLKIA